jgi:DNA-binding response OmpR family regulator
MPGRNAVDALVEIRRLGGCCPIVLFSGFADEETRGRALREGAAMLLDKPVDPRLLVCAVRVLLEPLGAEPSEPNEGKPEQAGAHTAARDAVERESSPRPTPRRVVRLRQVARQCSVGSSKGSGTRSPLSAAARATLRYCFGSMPTSFAVSTRL